MTLAAFLPIGGLLSFFLAKFSGAADCNPGIEWYWDGSWFSSDSAHFDSGDHSGSHTPSFRGSFIPSFDGTHTFKMEATTYGASYTYTPKVQFRFDGTDYAESEKTRTIQVDLKKEFRYSLYGRVCDGYLYVEVWLWVSWSGQSEHIVTNIHGQRCEISGCENTAFSRTYNCKPSPSRSPSLTVSHAPSATVSHSPSPTVSHSPSPTASREFTASQRLSVSGHLSLSNSFDATHFHSQTQPPSESSSLSASRLTIFTQFFTSGQPCFRRRGLLMRSSLFVWVLWLPPST
jgi:hypothetical protein